MVELKDVWAVDNGAKFLNADLHVHLFGASADVRDQGMTPAAIIESGLAKSPPLLKKEDLLPYVLSEQQQVFHPNCPSFALFHRPIPLHFDEDRPCHCRVGRLAVPVPCRFGVDDCVKDEWPDVSPTAMRRNRIEDPLR